MMSPIFNWAQVCIEVLDSSGNALRDAEIRYQFEGRVGTVFTSFNGVSDTIPVSPSLERELIIEITHLGYISIKDTLSKSQFKTYALSQNKFNLEPIVITGEHGPKPSTQSIRRIEVIDLKKIDQLGANSVADALRQQLNLNLSSDNFLGNSISIQGFSGQNVKILLNGVPLVGRLNGNIDLSQIPVSDIERIEIVKGPLSVEYGTDALGGTINIITKTSSESYLQASQLIESIGHYNSSGSFNLNNKNHQLRIGGGRNYFDGWSQTDQFIQWPKPTLADSGRVQDFKPKMQYFLHAGYRYHSKKIRVNPYIRIFNEELTNRGFPRQPYLDSAFDDVFVTDRTNLGLNGSIQFKESKSLEFKSSYNRYKRKKNTYLKDLTTLVLELANSGDVQDTVIMNLQNTRITYKNGDKENFSFQVGLDANHEVIDGQRISQQSNEIVDLGFFLTSELQLSERFQLMPGIRYVYNNKFGSKPIPSLSMRTQHKNLVLRSSIAKAFRAPTLKEMYLDFVDINHNIQGNPDLKAEDGFHLSSNIDYSMNQSKSSIQLGLNLFYNQVKDQIRLVSSDNANSFTYQNIGEFFATGYESTFRIVLSKLDVNIGLGMISSKDDITQSLGSQGFDHRYQQTASVTFDLLEDKLFCSLNYKHIGESNNLQIADETEFALIRSPSIDLLDMSLSYRPIDSRFSFSVGLKNLLNEQNALTNSVVNQVHTSNSNSPVLQSGISLFTTLKYEMKW